MANIEFMWNIEQGTDEWLGVRAGIVTCSELSKVMAKGEGKVRSKYMRQVAGEIITSEPAENYFNHHMQRGKDQEAKARELLQKELDVPFHEIGFIKNHDLRLGCSPDALIGDRKIGELKCCLADIQIERLDKKTVPTEYWAQVQGGLLASGLDGCYFQSYSPMLPRLVLEVEPDKLYFEKIEEELAHFNDELDEMVERIMNMF